MTAHPIVEWMSPARLPDVLRIERSCFSDPWSFDSFRHELARIPRGGYPRVLLDGEEVRAFSIGWFQVGEGHLANLAVAPAYRRLGYGQILLLDFVAEGERRGVERYWLEVRAGNQAAITLYRSRGFRVIGRRRGYYHKEQEDALVMVLERSTEGG